MLIFFCPECRGELKIISYNMIENRPLGCEYICSNCGTEFVVEHLEDGIKICSSVKEVIEWK